MATTTALLPCESQKRSLEEDSLESCKIIKSDDGDDSLDDDPPICESCNLYACDYLFTDDTGRRVHFCRSCKKQSDLAKCGLCHERFELSENGIEWIDRIASAGSKKFNRTMDISALVDPKLASFFHSECLGKGERFGGEDFCYCGICDVFSYDGTISRKEFEGGCEDSNCQSCHLRGHCSCFHCRKCGFSECTCGKSDWCSGHHSSNNPCKICGFYIYIRNDGTPNVIRSRRARQRVIKKSSLESRTIYTNRKPIARKSETAKKE
jgi:hypothetical protein